MASNHFSRRRFLAASGAGALALPLAGCNPNSTKSAKKTRKPNLLFLWTDEQHYRTLAAYGNTFIQTPALNQLARESIVFQNAYVTQPVCSPSRSSVMTGLWPHTNGVVENNIPLPANIPCLPEMIGPDYKTAYMGKWHLGDEVYAQHGFEEWISIEDYNRHFTPGRDRLKMNDYHHFLLSKGYEPDQEKSFEPGIQYKTFNRTFAARRPFMHCKPRFLEYHACDFLRRSRNHPFVLYVNFLEPHMPFFGPLDDLYDPEQVQLPPNYNNLAGEDDPLSYRSYQQAMNKIYKTDNPDEMKQLIARYYGLVTQVDFSIGRILQTLEELDLSENTIVVFTSDHGDMMGAHQMMTKSQMYEESARVPFLMRIPQLGMPHRVIRNPVSHIDLVPTLLKLMGAKSPSPLPGHSLVPLIQGKQPQEEHVFLEWNSLNLLDSPHPVNWKDPSNQNVWNDSFRAVVSPDGWKLNLACKDKCQLFHLKEDPGETVNLFYSGRRQDVIRRLTEKIRRWQQQTDDCFPLDSI